MSKNTVSTIISKGTAKQRATLLLEHYERAYHSKPLLTDKEEIALEQSFKTPKDREIWGRAISLRNLFTILAPVAEKYTLCFEAVVSSIEHTITMNLANCEAADRINTLLYMVGEKDKKLQKELAKEISKQPSHLLLMQESEEKGFIEPAIDFFNKTDIIPFAVLQRHKEDATLALKEAKTAILAIREGLSFAPVKVKAYEETLDLLEKMLKEPRIIYSSFSKSRYIEKYGDDGVEKREKEGYFVYPEYEEVEVEREEVQPILNKMKNILHK